jgi:aspartate-semialdehyde dehydrogenase
MPIPRDSQRIVIAGASSLLGAELKSLLEESRFAGWDFSLLDEETAVGTLTEAAGEPVVIQPVEDGSFVRAKLIFFTGSAAFTERNLPAARDSGATVIDLSGGALNIIQRLETPKSPALQGPRVWFAIDPVGDTADQPTRLYAIPSAPGLVTSKLLHALQHADLTRLTLIFFRPVSEAGRPGIEELESQTTQLLSFQSAGEPVFHTQVAFNLLDRYGANSRENLPDVRARIRREASLAAGRNLVQPSIQVLHAPVFYGYTFLAIADLDAKQSKDALAEICRQAGFTLDADASSPLGNLNASGDSAIHLALPEDDSAHPGTWWFWGAADNIRLPAATAVKLAEKLSE